MKIAIATPRSLADDGIVVVRVREQANEGSHQKLGVLLEAVSADVKMALEGISGNRQVMDKQFAAVAEKP